jgi:hypothetical protein
MKRTRLFALAVCTMIVLGGCGSKPQETSGNAAVQEQKPNTNTNTNTNQTPEPPKPDASKPDAAKPETSESKSSVVDLELVKTKLKDSMTKDQVTKLLGDKYTKVTSALDDAEVWRYDIEPKAGYKFDAKEDMPDLAGIKNKNVKAQLFVSWDPGTKKTAYSAYVYYDEQKKKILSYYAGGELNGKVDEIQ